MKILIKNKLTANSNVYPKQVLIVEANNPSKASKGFGWKYTNCSGSDEGKNLKQVTVTITGESGIATIEYGDLNNENKRQKISFNIQAPSTTSSTNNSSNS